MNKFVWDMLRAPSVPIDILAVIAGKRNIIEDGATKWHLCIIVCYPSCAATSQVFSSQRVY